MMKTKVILPSELADKFSVDPKAPVRFVHRIHGEYDLSKINAKQAKHLADNNIYLKPVKKPSADKS